MLALSTTNTQHLKTGLHYFTLIVMKTKYNETKRVQTRILRYTLKMLAIQVYVYNINNVGDDLL